MHTTGTLVLAIGLCAAFLAILSLLHVLEPEFNPPHLISEYQLGRFGWLMSVAFFCLGAAGLALFGAARQETDSKLGRFGAWGLLIISVAYFLAGTFPPDPEFYGSILALRVSSGSSTVVGWTNRFLITTFVLWLLIAAFHLWRRN
jgi:Protein of unknown function (DUF998)